MLKSALLLGALDTKELRKPNFSIASVLGITHTAYSYSNKCQKCAGMGLNGFIFKKINKNYAENMKKIVL